MTQKHNFRNRRTAPLIGAGVLRHSVFKPSADSSLPPSIDLPNPIAENTHGVHSDDPTLDALDSEADFIGSQGGLSGPLTHVKHSEPYELFKHRAFNGHARFSLAGFLKRAKASPWMRDQRGYVNAAALAAAHTRQSSVIVHAGGWPSISHFNGFGFLKCGLRFRQPMFGRRAWECAQPEYCPRCNLFQRVEPFLKEFVPAFPKRPYWYTLTLMARSGPAEAGVRNEVGRDANGSPVFDTLFELGNDAGNFPKCCKFGVDGIALPVLVAEGLYRVANWLTDGRYLDGVAIFRDVDLTIFPRACVEQFELIVDHTINCHFHGIANGSRPWTPAMARRIWRGAMLCMLKVSQGQFIAYPDILIRPILSVDDMPKAINYVIKPFRFSDWYIEALGRGCGVGDLNHLFHQTGFGVETLFPGNPYGTRFGNMGLKARHRYIGAPRPRKMSRKQVRRFLERLDAGEVTDWEMQRFEAHTQIVALQKGASAAGEEPA